MKMINVFIHNILFRRLVPSFLRGNLHTGVSEEKRKEVNANL